MLTSSGTCNRVSSKNITVQNIIFLEFPFGLYICSHAPFKYISISHSPMSNFSIGGATYFRLHDGKVCFWSVANARKIHCSLYLSRSLALCRSLSRSPGLFLAARLRSAFLSDMRSRRVRRRGNFFEARDTWNGRNFACTSFVFSSTELARAFSPFVFFSLSRSLLLSRRIKA